MSNDGWFSTALPHRPTATLALRAARTDEIPLIQEIERTADAQYAAAGHPELADGEVIDEAQAQRVIEAGRLFVLAEHDVVVGWAYVGRCGDEPCLGQICILPSHGRRGFGTIVLEHVIETARRRGETTIVLSTQRDVPWNRPWYARHGFVDVPEAAWTEAMQKQTEGHRLAGLRVDTRAHMRLTLFPSAAG